MPTIPRLPGNSAEGEPTQEPGRTVNGSRLDIAAAKKRFAPYADADGDCVRCGEKYEEEGHACAEGFLPSDEECVAAALGLLPAALEALEAVDWVRKTRPHSDKYCKGVPHPKAECDRCALDAILGESE